MKTHLKKLLIALGSVGTIGAATLGSVIAYGKYSESARGFRLGSDGEHSFYWGKDYKMNFIDESGVNTKLIGKFEPGVNGAEGTVNGTPVSKWVRNYKNAHNKVAPVLRIKTGMFNFENRYLSAVTADDWFKFVVWYVGDDTHPGHLSFGPEAGQLETFQIVPGVKDEGDNIILGGMSSVYKEDQKITFYPDAFFGNLTSHSNRPGLRSNRLLEVALTTGKVFAEGKQFTLEEANTFLSFINKTNKYNGEHASFFSEFNSDETRGSYTFNGDNSPKPYYLEPAGWSADSNGKQVKKYRIYMETFTPKYPTSGSKSLMARLTEEFPELATRINGKHIVKNSKGEFSIAEGDFDIIVPGQIIGLAQILKVLHPSFQGFGIDFLKYVGVHEYGHHETLARAKDTSEGGVQVGSVHSESPFTSNGLHNFNVLKEYLKARSKGLLLSKIDPVTGDKVSDSSSSIYTKFLFNNGQEESMQDIIGTDPAGTGLNGRAYQTSLETMKNEYVKNHPWSSLYNAFLMNSFDWVSGFMNPELNLHAVNNIVQHDHYEISQLGQDMVTIVNKHKVAYKAAITKLITENSVGVNPAGIKADIDTLMDYFKDEKEFVTQFSASLALYDWFNQPVNLVQVEDNMIPALSAMLKTNSANFTQSEQDKIREFEEIYTKKENIGDIARKLVTEVSSFLKVANTKYAHTFYDASSGSWKSFGQIIGTWVDGKGNKVFTATTSTSPDLDVEKLVKSLAAKGAVSIKDEAVNSKYNLIDPEQIIGASGETFWAHYRRTHPGATNKAEAKKFFIDHYIKPKISAILSATSWKEPSTLLTYDPAVSRPQTTDFARSDYVFQFPEVMTRDFVQITLSQEGQALSNLGTDGFLGLTQSATSLEYFVDKGLTQGMKYNSENAFTLDDAKRWMGNSFKTPGSGVAYKNGLMKILTTEEKAIWRVYSPNIFGWAFMDESYMINNEIFGLDKYMSNGYELDHQQRAALGWSLYDDATGGPRTILPEHNIHIRLANRGPEAKTWAQAYWYFLLNSNGIGDRALTGLFRTPQDDHEYMYGYLPNQYKSQVKYMAYRNMETGETKYQQVHKERISNMFYLTHQGDINSRHTLDEEGYFAWATDKFTAGGFTNTFLGAGKYEIYFADSNKHRINGPNMLGSRHNISENGKGAKTSATGVHLENGRVVFYINEHFN